MKFDRRRARVCGSIVSSEVGRIKLQFKRGAAQGVSVAGRGCARGSMRAGSMRVGRQRNAIRLYSDRGGSLAVFTLQDAEDYVID